jgi:hypothetical protein
MSKDFTPYQEALEIKELEFDEPCFGEYRQWDGSKPYLQLYQDLDGCSTDPADYEYTTECQAPTYSQAFRWFREKYNLFGQVNIHTYFIYNISNDGFEMIKQYDKLTNTYEEAELACLNKLIEIVKQKK